jgi:hypothetical protein
VRLIVIRTLLLSCNSSQRRLFDEPLDFSDSGRRVQHEGSLRPDASATSV